MGTGDTAISCLPSSHSGGRFYRHYYPLARGGQVTCVADPAWMDGLSPDELVRRRILAPGERDTLEMPRQA
ncbi:hypothetical protein [Actinoplanes sp. NPDC026623]|uniref:hypothetical protein n=1 Tax=Actinoplanes sp. NPDC026623 TaxID=3155610 RepID=UPI0033E809BF